jgi:hypothetical protein
VSSWQPETEPDVPWTTPGPGSASAPAAAPTIPTMAMLDRFNSDLDEIDEALARMDAETQTPTPTSAHAGDEDDEDDVELSPPPTPSP